jgi:hypothetical protein
MKVDVVATARDYGFGLTAVVSVVRDSDGVSLDGLSQSNFKFTLIQGPSGWSVGDVFKITSMFTPAPSIYAFALQTSSGGKVPAGHYTIGVTMQGSKGWATVRGETLTTATMQ